MFIAIQKIVLIVIYTPFIVGKKGEKGESSKPEIAIVEKTVSNLQKNTTETLGNCTTSFCFYKI